MRYKGSGGSTISGMSFEKLINFFFESRNEKFIKGIIIINLVPKIKSGYWFIDKGGTNFVTSLLLLSQK